MWIDIKENVVNKLTETPMLIENFHRLLLKIHKGILHHFGSSYRVWQHSLLVQLYRGYLFVLPRHPTRPDKIHVKRILNEVQWTRSRNIKTFEILCIKTQEGGEQSRAILLLSFCKIITCWFLELLCFHQFGYLFSIKQSSLHQCGRIVSDRKKILGMKIPIIPTTKFFVTLNKHLSALMVSFHIKCTYTSWRVQNGNLIDLFRETK